VGVYRCELLKGYGSMCSGLGVRKGQRRKGICPKEGFLGREGEGISGEKRGL
jgi:hypothetical protein